MAVREGALWEITFTPKLLQFWGSKIWGREFPPIRPVCHTGLNEQFIKYSIYMSSMWDLLSAESPLY